MTKISIAALLTAAWAISAPAYAQDASASAEISTSVDPSAPTSEPAVSVEASGDVSAAASSESSAPSALDAGTGGGASFDLDTSVDVNITAEESAQIRSFVAGSGVQPIEVNFDVKIGAPVPSTVTLAPLPAQVIQLVPAFNGYLFFTLGDGRIVVVSPTTLKVVLIVYA